MSIVHLFPLAIFITVIYFLIMAYAIIRMQPDYFIRKNHKSEPQEQHFIIWFISKSIKNLIGIILIIVGFLLLFLPGQGLLTILMGLFFVDFPGKRRFELYLIRHRSIRNSINWIRKIAKKPPIEIEES